MSKIWQRLAEAVGIETEANWDNVAKKRNMQRYGTQDRRTPQGPTQYFNAKGTGSAQTPPGGRPPIPARPGGLQIPTGSDRPGQGNPLTDPPKKPGGLSQAPNSPSAAMATQPAQGMPGSPPPNDHHMGDDDWLAQIYGDDDQPQDGQENESAFSKLSHELGHEKGVEDPDALAASIGRKKYGRKG